MGRVGRAAQLSAIALALLAACSLAVREDDYVGGPGDRNDAAAPGDGGSSCTFPGKTFCAAIEGGAYCNDFDEAPVDTDRIVVTEGAAAALDCTASQSSPNALRSSTGEGSEAGAKGQHYVLVNDVAKYLRVSFDVLVETVAVGDSVLAEMRLEKSGKVERILRILIGKDQMNASLVKLDNFAPDGGVLQRMYVYSDAVELGPGFRHIDFEVVLGNNSPYRARGCVDGVERVYKENDGVNLAPSGRVFVGLETLTATGAQQVRIDNVVVTRVMDTPPDGGGACCTCGK